MHLDPFPLNVLQLHLGTYPQILAMWTVAHELSQALHSIWQSFMCKYFIFLLNIFGWLWILDVMRALLCMRCRQQQGLGKEDRHPRISNKMILQTPDKKKLEWEHDCLSIPPLAWFNSLARTLMGTDRHTYINQHRTKINLSIFFWGSDCGEKYKTGHGRQSLGGCFQFEEISTELNAALGFSSWGRIRPTWIHLTAKDPAAEFLHVAEDSGTVVLKLSLLRRVALQQWQSQRHSDDDATATRGFLLNLGVSGGLCKSVGGLQPPLQASLWTAPSCDHKLEVGCDWR